MSSLPTPFKYPAATFYSLAEPFISLALSLNKIPVIDGRIQIQFEHLRALFRRLTCDRLEGGVVWSTKKITLLTLSAASVAVSFIAPWTIMMPLVFYVGYRMYKVCLIRQLLDRNIDPSHLVDYLSGPAPLLIERVPDIADLYGLLNSSYRALIRISGGSRLTLAKTDHDQITEFTPELMRHPAHPIIRFQVFNLLEKLNSDNRPHFYPMMIDVLKKVTDPGLQNRILSWADLYPNANQQMSYLLDIWIIITNVPDEHSIPEVIREVLPLNDLTRGELIRKVLVSRGDQVIIPQISTSGYDVD
jgi:hypothetical protein